MHWLTKLGFTRRAAQLPGGGRAAGFDSARVLDVLVGNLEGMAFRCAIDDHWTMLFVSPGCSALTGYEPSDLIMNRRVSYEDLTHPDDRELVRGTIRAALKFDRRYQVEYRVHCADGTEKWVLERGQGVKDEAGTLVLEGFIEDITARVLSQLQLADTALRYRSMFEQSEVGMFQSAADGRYLAANQALANLYGYESAQAWMDGLVSGAIQRYVNPARQEDFQRLIQERGRVRDFESEAQKADGSPIWISENAHGVYDATGLFLYYEGTVIDVTERHHYQRELEFQATHDALTGLPNRNLLADRLTQSMHIAGRQETRCALAFVDLDNFKVINDTLGHGTGDQLLVAIAQRLLACVRGSDTVARYGGDEFVLILQAKDDLSDLAHLLERIQESVADPVELACRTLHVTCSIGVSLYPDDGFDLDSLLQHADAAMYHAKSSGKGRFQFYTDAFNLAVSQRFAMEGALRRAIASSSLTVVYQPRVGALGKVCSCEALVRWSDPQLGPVGPDRFIPLAEETGLITAITRQVLSQACRDAMDWRAYPHPPSLAVNVSSRLFSEGLLMELIQAALEESGLPPQRLEVEITESVLAGDVEHAVRQLEALKSLGITVALDDFGTGYSALAYLRKFPIDVLKVDRSFVLECDQSEDARALVRAIISMGHSLGLRIVAEGIEREGQFVELQAHGCEEFQGFLLARPMGAGALQDFLQERYSLQA